MDFKVDVDLPTVEIPCPKLPELPSLPNITLLGGAELKAFLNIAEGPGTDCKLTFNLLLQLGPLLASMACLFKIMNVMGALKEFVSAPLNPAKAVKVVDSIVELTACIPVFAIPQIILMIKAIIELIIRFISCVIEFIMSIMNLLSNIDINISLAGDNPALLSVLNCSKENANASMTNAMTALDALAPILMMIQAVASIAGTTIAPLPDIPSMKNAQDPAATIAALQGAMASLQQIHDGLDPNAYTAGDPNATSDEGLEDVV